MPDTGTWCISHDVLTDLWGEWDVWDGRGRRVARTMGEDDARLLSATADLLAALKATIRRCGICGEIATWDWSDEDGIEYTCDQHKHQRFYRYSPDEVASAREAIAAIARAEGKEEEDA